MNLQLGATHTPLTRLVTDAIRERILSGEYALGERLVEGKLSEELGVSRMPVREALRELASEGLVTIEPRRGAAVTNFTEEQKREMVEVRATLEALNAKLAAKRHDPEQIKHLKKILDEGPQESSEHNMAEVMKQNARVHDALANVAGNSVLSEMMRTLRAQTSMVFAAINRDRYQENWEEHAAIMKAVIDGDADLAALLAARHVYNAAQIPPEA
jgi:DNA-binding GntR family transcriptional regulator